MHPVISTKLPGISHHPMKQNLKNVHVNLRSLWIWKGFFYCLALSVFENYRSKQQPSLNYYRKQNLFRGYRGVKSDFLLFEVISVRHSNVCSRRRRQCRISQAGRTQGGGASRGSSLREHNKIQLLADRREKAPLFSQPMRPITSVRLWPWLPASEDAPRRDALPE